MLNFLKSTSATFLTAIIQVFGQFRLNIIFDNLSFRKTADGDIQSQTGIHQSQKKQRLPRSYTLLSHLRLSASCYPGPPPWYFEFCTVSSYEEFLHV
jgi:hypothetical protein